MPANVPAGIRLAPVRVLLVSNNEQKRARISTSLGESWKTSVAHDGVEALHLAKTQEFDLVVTDEIAEPYGAFGLTRELKLLDAPPAVIVLLSRPQDAGLARWSGADHAIVEPVSPRVLAAEAARVAAAGSVRRPGGPAGGDAPPEEASADDVAEEQLSEPA